VSGGESMIPLETVQCTEKEIDEFMTGNESLCRALFSDNSK
jgi:hypothetical protein